jgi:hypothetical protein
MSLHPAGADSSYAAGVHDGWQVGVVIVGAEEHASVWSGDAESWEDISLALPGSWSRTSARGVWSDGATLYVVGSGLNNDTGRIEALLWSRPIPCRVDLNGDGVVDTRDVLAFLNLWTAGDDSADFDGNGVVDTRDVLGFLNAWVAGC